MNPKATWRTAKISRMADNNNLRSSPAGQRGNILILTAVLLPLMLGITALAVDMGYLYVVRGELQNAADAAAAAGAGFLYQASPSPNWTLAQTQATKAIALNKAVNAQLYEGRVEYGYYDSSKPYCDSLQTPPTTASPAASPPSCDSPPPYSCQLLPTTITPTATQFAAVKVTICKASKQAGGLGWNGGAVISLFANVPGIGIKTVPVSAQSIAAVVLPTSATVSANTPGAGAVGAGKLFPVAMSKCMYDKYWDTDGDDDDGDGVPDAPHPINDPSTGKPYVFKVGSSYHYSACQSGQWTSFDSDDNDVPTIRGFIPRVGYTPNSPAMSVGDDTWIEPGTKNTLFNSVEGCSANGDKTCEYAVMPVVADAAMGAKGATPILAFACIHIDSAVGGSATDIQVEMVGPGNPNCVVFSSYGKPPGPSCGVTVALPKRVQ